MHRFLYTHPVTVLCLLLNQDTYTLHPKSVQMLAEHVGGLKKLTHRFASPLPFAIPKTNTLKHVVSCFVGPLPSVPYFVRPPILMATIWFNR